MGSNDSEVETKWHVTCKILKPKTEIKQYTVYATDAVSAIMEARIILGEGHLDSEWNVRPATDRLPYNTSYVDYLFNNGKRHAR